MAKLIAIVALLSLLGFGIFTLWTTAYQSGENAERTRQAAAVGENLAAEKVVVKQIIKWRDKERIVYRDRIQQIHTAADTTGCLNTDLRDVGLGFMLPATGNH